MVADVWFFLIAVPAVLFAGISKGGFGSGAAFASAAILAIVLPPAQALGIMLPLLMLMDVTSLRSYWRQWDWPEARILLLGGVPGVALGAGLFTVANDDVLRLLIGVIALGFVIYRIWPSQRAQGRMPVWAGAVAGVFAGFTSFVSHAGGPPVAVYLLSRGIGKTTYQATTVIVFWAINIAKAVPYAFLGVFTWESLTLDLWLAPFAVLGAWLGFKAHHRVPEWLFFGLTYVMLSLTGVKLIWDAVT